MALFKISRGDSAKLLADMTTVPFTEGHAYFTPDDPGFYIDALVDGAQKRIRISQKETVAAEQPANMADGDTWLKEVG